MVSKTLIEWLVSIDNLAVTNDDGCDFEDQLNYNLALNGMKPLALTDHFKLHRYIHLRYLAYERYLGEFPSGDIYFVSQHLADHLTTYFNDFPNNIKSQLVAFRNDLDAMKIGDEVSQWCKGAVEDWMTEHKTYLDAYANQQKMDAKTRSIMVNFVREVVKDTFGIGDSDAYEAAQKALKGVAGTLVNRQANALIFEKELLKTMALECGIHAQKNDIEAGDIVSCIQNR